MFLRSFSTKRKDGYLAHVDQAVQDILESGRSIDHQEWCQLRINSYERELLAPQLDNQAFAAMLRTYLTSGQISETDKYSTPPSTYNEGIEQKLIHQLLRRFEGLLQNGQ